MSNWTHHRAVIAAKQRHHPDADLTEDRRALRAARAEDYIRKLVDEAPRLSDEQRSRLAVILRDSAGGAAA